MKKGLVVALGVFVFIFAALLVGPSFIDWNKYKPQIIEQAKSAAGYDVKINGDINLSLIPAPRLIIDGLTVGAPRGNEPVLLNMKRAEVSVNLLPLISGNIEVDTVRFVNPDICLEILPDGSNSWMSDKLLEPKEEGASSGQTDTSGSSKNIALNKIEISDGQVKYTDRKTGKVQEAGQINLDMKAGSLEGPFDVEGSFAYGGKTVEIDASAKKGAGAKKETPVDITLALPDSNAYAKFGGVVAMEPALEVQGQMDVKADNLGSVIALVTGGEPSAALSKKLSFSGLVTASDEAFVSKDIAVEFGDAKGKGSVQAMNLKAQNPMQILADIAFEGTLNMDQLAPSKEPNQKSVEERIAKGEKTSGKASFFPETLSLPFPIDADIRVTADGIQSGGKLFKGITAQILKKDASFEAAAKIIEIPGKTTAEAKVNGRFASVSKSGEKGVTYADPSVNFTANGSSEQLPTLLRAFAPDQDGNAALEIWKTAQFDITGAIKPDAVTFTNSAVKLDNTTLGLAGSYKPDGLGGKPDVVIDMTSDTIDIDYIQTRLTGQKKQAVQKDPAAQKDVKKALEPVRGINVPVNLTFDLSAQKAIFNAQNISGIRIKGKASGNSLSLDNASAQDYMGAAASLSGSVANLQELSGIDLKFYGKTPDVKALMDAFKVDTTKLPQQIGSAEANISAKGQADNLAFNANVKALQGQLDASGNMTNLLDKPSFNNLTIGAKHPNFVKAIQIINPSFAGGAGLERPFDFYAKAVKEGETYDLSDFKANLGPTALSGSLKVATAPKTSVTGSIQAGTVPLDSLLGAKPASGKASASSASANTSGEKWSRDTIETGWMQTTNIDVSLKAQSITYGAWNLTAPSTKITLKDGNLLVDNLQAGLFGGTANLTAKVQDPADPKQPLALAIQSKMTNVALEPLVFAMSGSTRLKATGDVNLDMDVQSAGLSANALIGGLKGKANLNGTDVILKGFDLSQLALAFVDSGKPLDRLNSIVGGAVNGGETRFDKVTGAYDIQGGVAVITTMLMDGPAASIASSGNVNLPAWTIDTMHKVTLKQAKEDGIFNVAIKGPLSNPGNTFGKGLFNDVITRRAQQKVMEKLPDVLGDDLGGKLQDLGILPKKQIPDSPPPATPSDPSAAPTSDAPAAAQPAQEQPKSVEDQIKENPEKAIQGVLDGLLR